MKLKKNILRRRPKVLNNTVGEIELTIRGISEELLPMLIGMEVFWNVSPQLYLHNLPDKLRMRIISVLNLSGYIVGDDTNWKFTRIVYENLVKHLKANSIGAEMMEIAKKEPPVSLMELVSVYKKHLKPLPRLVKTPACMRPSPALRLLMKDFSSKIMLEALPKFFKWAMMGNQDVSPQAFKLFLRSFRSGSTQQLSTSNW